jgi:hypothetical protein
MDTGTTALAFATHELGASNLAGGDVKSSHSGEPLGMAALRSLCTQCAWRIRSRPESDRGPVEAPP